MFKVYINKRNLTLLREILEDNIKECEHNKNKSECLGYSNLLDDLNDGVVKIK